MKKKIYNAIKQVEEKIEFENVSRTLMSLLREIKAFHLTESAELLMKLNHFIK